MIDAIGGYLGLDFGGEDKEYYPDLIRLNSARNSLLFLLNKKEYRRIYIPFYTCGVIVDSLRSIKIEVVYYEIDISLEIIGLPEVNKNECLLYTNYFGVKDKYINEIVQIIPNLIIDNAQSFFSKPIKGVDTIYSPRKFFGLPDGGYLASDVEFDAELVQDVSYLRFIHLIKRVELGAESAFTDFKNNDEALNGQEIKTMSVLTKNLLTFNIDYEFIKQRRIDNFAFLEKELGGQNGLPIDLNKDSVPMCFPFYTEDSKLRDRLKENRIYTPTYWPDVISRVGENSVEYNLVNKVIPLPVDQRYTLEQLQVILNLII
jgi:hypothetical protein